MQRGAHPSALRGRMSREERRDGSEEMTTNVRRLFKSTDDVHRLFLRASELHDQPSERGHAMRLYQEIIRIAPRHVEALNNLGVLHFWQNEPAKALDAWGRALLADRYRADVLNNIGHLFQMEGKWRVAAYYLALAVESDPDMDEARVNLALVLQVLGRTKKAARHWSEILRRRPRGEFSNMARKYLGAFVEALPRTGSSG